MGPSCSKPLDKWKTDRLSVVLLGLSGTGKTTIFNKLTGGRDRAAQDDGAAAVPEYFSVGVVQLGNIQVELWDIHLPCLPRGLWRFFYAVNGKCAVALVVDVNDAESLPEAADHLQDIMQNPEACHSHVLVLANQFDAKTAQPADRLRSSLRLAGTGNVHVQPCDAVTGRGLRQGLHWLAVNVCKPQQPIDAEQLLLYAQDDDDAAEAQREAADKMKLKKRNQSRYDNVPVDDEAEEEEEDEGEEEEEGATDAEKMKLKKRYQSEYENVTVVYVDG